VWKLTSSKLLQEDTLAWSWWKKSCVEIYQQQARMTSKR
jgi:hypothetical protein